MDTDQWGRLLRYVQVGGKDFGVEMVGHDHTGVYKGEHDASGSYVELLYVHDLDFATSPPSGRECGDPNAPVHEDEDAHAYVEDDDDDDRDRDSGGGGSFCGRGNPFC